MFPTIQNEFVVNEQPVANVFAGSLQKNVEGSLMLRCIVTGPTGRRLIRNSRPSSNAGPTVIDSCLCTCRGRASLQIWVAKIFGNHAVLAVCRYGRKLCRQGHLSQRRQTAEVKRSDCDRIVADTFQKTNRGKWLHARAASSNRHRGISIRAYDRDRFDLSPAEWQHVAFILQQHHAFARGLQGCQTPLWVVTRYRQVRLIAIEPAKTNRRLQDASDLFINAGDRNFSLFDCRQKTLSVHEFSEWHLQIEPAICRPDCI